MAAVCAAYIGIFSVYVLMPSVRKYALIIGIFCFLLFVLSLFLRKGKKFSARKVIFLFLMMISIIAACLRSSAYTEKTEISAKHYTDGEAHWAEGKITKVLYEEVFGSAYELRLISLDDEKVEFGLVLTVYGDEELSVDDIIRFQSEMETLSGTYEIYRKADGIFLSSETEDVEVLEPSKYEEQTFLECIRLYIKNHFEMYLKEDTAGLATALMTGNRDGLDGGLKLAYTRLGISHILAVSGLHLTVMVGGLGWILTRLYVPKKLRNLILIASAVFFAFLCGNSASIVRAAVMLIFFCLADMVRERNDSTTSLFVAVFLIIFFRPNAVYDVGMWLSFFATLGILTVMPVLSLFSVSHKSKFYVLKHIGFYLISVIGMSLAATFFTLPVIWIAFGGISLLAPFANLIFIPLMQILLYLLVFLMLFSWFPWLALKIGELTEGLSEFSETLAYRLSNLEDIYISLHYPFVPYLLFVLIAGILSVLLIKKIRPAWMFAVFALFVIGFGISYGRYTEMNRDISFVYLETDGKSDTVGFFSEGESMIVDISTGGSSLYREVSQRLEDFCEAELDVLVLTHYHSYHAGTLQKLVNHLKIHQILLPEPKTDNEREYFARICSVISEKTEIIIYQTDTEEIVTVGEITLHLPQKEYLKRSSHPIVCFSADIGDDGKGFSYLGAGATETDFAEDIRSVTVLGTHGPTMKNIFDATLFENAELVIFSEKATSDWTEIEKISEKSVYAEDFGGYIRIMFE